jgi:signal peptidase I
MSDAAETPSADKEELTFGQKVKREAREWGVTLSIFVPLFLIFSGLVYELRVIPSESMVPNLQVGDRVAVNKFAYGYSRNSLPFSLGRYVPLPEGRIFASQPKRGDVAVFEHPHTARVMIKRIIGLPGDTVSVRNGIPVQVNGEPLDRAFQRRVSYVQHKPRQSVTAAEYIETVEGESWLTHDIDKYPGSTASTEFEVPEGYFLFMGDNRDNSMDGRNTTGHCPENGDGVIDQGGCPPRFGVSDENASVGYVPFDNLIGRADTVLFTTYRCGRANAEPCMKKRLWRGL